MIPSGFQILMCAGNFVAGCLVAEHYYDKRYRSRKPRRVALERLLAATKGAFYSTKIGSAPYDALKAMWAGVETCRRNKEAADELEAALEQILNEKGE